MRRKSDRTKEKEKPSPEKKSERGTRRSRRHSKRRRRSSSPSDDSGDDVETSLKSSVHETEVDQKGKGSKEETDQDGSHSKDKSVDEDTGTKSSCRTRRSSKKQTTESSVSRTDGARSDDEWKEDKSFWEGDENKNEASDTRHKEKEGKSSVWQVKSSNDGGSSGSGGGEIQKIKLCIVRPPETAEASPRRRKRLSRSSSSHKDKSDEQEYEDVGEKDGRKTLESSEEKQDIQEGGSRKEHKSSEDKSSEVIQKMKSENKQDVLEEKPVNSENVADETVTIPSEKQSEDQAEASSAIKVEVNSDVVNEGKATDSHTDGEEPAQEASKSEVEETVLKNHSVPSEKQSVKSEIQETKTIKEEPLGVTSREVDAGDSAVVECKRSESPEEKEIPHDSLEKQSVEEKSASRESSADKEERHTADSSEERSAAQSSPERRNLPLCLEEGQIQDSSEENSASQEVSKIDSKVKQAVSISRDKLNRHSTSKYGYGKERSHSRESSDDKEERKNHRQSRDSSSSRSFSRSPAKQTHRKSERDSSRHSERSEKHKRRDSNRSSSPEREASRSRSPQRRREKISLRRSFSRKSEGDKTELENSENKLGSSADGSSPHIKEDKENHRKTSENSGTGVESSQSLTRRRRWGASKLSRPGKKPVLSISTDSLKNLIPGAKPVPISEVQLSQEEEDRGRDRDIEEIDENEEPEKVEKSRIKDRERDTQDSPIDKKPVGPTVSEPHKISVAVTDDRGKAVTRKISIVSDDARTLQNSPSPPRHKASNVLFITNLVRPFTVNQLKELLARTGTIIDGGFWIDKIKSKCYVQYETETEARETRHALHGVRWPVSNPKTLCVDFGKKEDMDLAQAMSEEDQIPRKTEPLKVERTVEGWVAEQVREKEREREIRERERERERDRDRTRGKERPHHAVPSVESVERNRNLKMSASVREWDLGKIGQLSPSEREQRHEEKNKERDRRIRRDKTHHSRSPSPHDVPARKQKKKDDDAPAKLLDDLFRKTKSTPCIYWLPLTAEQIVVKEEMRRRHMAEHERRMAEMRKAERDRERARAQQRQQRRTGDRDKRRRRTTSGSPKK